MKGTRLDVYDRTADWLLSVVVPGDGESAIEAGTQCVAKLLDGQQGYFLVANEQHVDRSMWTPKMVIGGKP